MRERLRRERAFDTREWMSDRTDRGRQKERRDRVV